MPNPTVSKIGESGLVFSKNKTTNQVETIATTADMQIGLPNSSASLTITGNISLKTIDVSLASGAVYDAPNDVTNINVTTSGSSGTATIQLPSSPKNGQLIYVKDAGGNAGTISITLTGSPSGTKTVKGTSPHLIDGSASKSITTSYGALQLLWNGSGWSIVSNINIVTTPAPGDASYVVLSSNATLTNERVLTAGSNISIVDGGAGSTLTISATGGTGDVVGPASATDNAIARFDLTTGKLIQNSAATVADSTGNITTYDAEVGSLSGFAGTYAMFGHKTQTALGQYAIVHKNDGETWLNSKTDKYIRFTTDGNLTYDGYIGYSTLFSKSIVSLTGRSGVKTSATLGNTAADSDTTIDSGTGNIDIGTSSTSRTINVGTGLASQTINLGASWSSTAINLNAGTGRIDMSSTSTTSADATIGAAQVGSLPGSSGGVAMFGHNNLNHAVNNDTALGMGNYALAQLSTGETYINSIFDKGIYFAASGSTNYLGRVYFDSGDLTSKIILEGASTFDTDISLGSSYGGSRTDVTAGSGNMFLSVTAGNSINIAPDPLGVTNQVVQIGNNTTATEINIKAGDEFAGVGGVNITAPMTARGELAAGAVQLGSLPLFGYPRTVAFFGNNSLNHSVNPTTLDGMGNYALAQGTDGSTYLNSPWNKGIYFLTSGSGLFPLGRIYFNSNTSTSEISFKGVETLACNLSLGSVTGSSSTKMFGGSEGILLSTATGLTTITGSTSTSTEAIIGMAAVGELPFTRVSSPNSYAVFSHKTLNNSVNGNYALVQSYDGYTYLNSPTSITFQYAGSSMGGGTIGTLDNNTVSFTGLAGTATTTTIGNTAGASSTIIDAGTGNIDIGTSATARTINVGPTGVAGVTFTINIGTSTGGGTSGSPRTINIGEYGAGYSAVNLEADYVNVAKNASSALGFYGASPKTKFTVTGSRGGNAALLAVLDVLDRLGLISDSSTA